MQQTIARIDTVPAPERVDQDRSGAHPVRYITPGRSSLKHLLPDLWRYRVTLYFLTWRDIKVKYKQTALGAAWAILQPVLTVAVLSVFFGRYAGIAKLTGHIPYTIFLYAGVLPWTFFAQTLGNCANSVVSNAALVTKVRFPRIALPLASVGSGLVDFAIAFTVLVALMLWYHVPVTPRILFAPLLVVGLAGVAFGFGSFFAALTVSYRDFRYVIPFLTQVWMFLTPVIYPASMIPHKLRWLIDLNPLAGLVGSFRAVFLGAPVDTLQIALSGVVSLALVIGGAAYFLSVERRFADII
ncbi:MAG TPA: ABC transporter permease [Capsulimonadaceae bacterium]|nr:ABC transporter permease [Capsulimonadaceae bacterium]